jgi:hypothetical protein
MNKSGCPAHKPGSQPLLYHTPGDSCYVRGLTVPGWCIPKAKISTPAGVNHRRRNRIGRASEADTSVRPYPKIGWQPDDAVKVIGHDHECIQSEGKEFCGQRQPPGCNQFACYCDRRCLCIAKKAASMLGADRHEVGSGGRVVVTAQANRLPMPFWSIRH